MQHTYIGLCHYSKLVFFPNMENQIDSPNRTFNFFQAVCMVHTIMLKYSCEFLIFCEVIRETCSLQYMFINFYLQNLSFFNRDGIVRVCIL